MASHDTLGQIFTGASYGLALFAGYSVTQRIDYHWSYVVVAPISILAVAALTAGIWAVCEYKRIGLYGSLIVLLGSSWLYWLTIWAWLADPISSEYWPAVIVASIGFAVGSAIGYMLLEDWLDRQNEKKASSKQKLEHRTRSGPQLGEHSSFEPPDWYKP
jgi:hypothetical protein